MSFGIGVGDIIVLGKLAFDLGQTFTSGRKGAPASFRQVGNQLFALETALELLNQAVEDRDVVFLANAQRNPGLENGQGYNGLKRMLESCNEVLDNLKKITDKYSDVLGGSGSGTSAGGIAGIGIGQG